VQWSLLQQDIGVALTVSDNLAYAPCSNFRVKAMQEGRIAIGQLAQLAATKVETIRYYERINLLEAPARTAGNYRTYGQADVNRLSFIRRSRDLGFSLDQVRSLLRLSDERHQSCAEVDRIANAQLAEVTSKIADLCALRDVLQDLIGQCRHGTVADCRIIEALGPPTN
jgi:DNA-binding transcriptional MerR regulator